MTQKGSFAVTNGHFIPLPLIQGAETTINQHQSWEPKPRRTKLRKLKYVNVKHVNMKLKPKETKTKKRICDEDAKTNSKLIPAK
jgi:hypothetical protein